MMPLILAHQHAFNVNDYRKTMVRHLTEAYQLVTKFLSEADFEDNCPYVFGAPTEMSTVDTYQDVEIAAERRTGGVQLNEPLSWSIECRLEEAHRAG